MGETARTPTDQTMDALLTELATILGVPRDELPPVFQRYAIPKALKIGIENDLLMRFTAVDPERLANWLARWTRTDAYLKRIVLGRNRHDLDDDHCGMIQSGQRAWARRQRRSNRGEEQE